ncbi:MAG: immunoglobulin-like domain-containing protein, partial [Bacteroidota bacterium]
MKNSTYSIFVVAILSLFQTITLVAQISYPFRDLNFSVNSTLNTVAVDEANNITYVGGFFTRVNTASNGVELDPVSALNSKDYPQPNGSVFASVSDGSGGYYIGGTFTKVGGYDRQYLAHINSVGEVTAWDPSPDNSVNALALGGGTLYVSGFFQNIGGQSREYLAAIDMNGDATSWAPTVSSPSINTIAVDGSTVYLGGSFTSINSTFQNRLAAVDLNGSLIPGWNANVGGGGFNVNDISVKNSIIYFVGSFTLVNGTARNRLAAVDNTGTLTSWNPDANGIVRSITFEGDTAYIGGDFTSITTGSGTSSRNYLAALDMSGELTSWDPDAFHTVNQNAVLTLSAVNGVIYVGGNFRSIQGQPRSRVAAITTSGVLQDWNPSASGTARTLTVSNNGIYVGGDFTAIAGIARSGLAAFDANGDVTDWNPSVNSSIRVITVGGDRIYVGGDFTEIAGAPRDRLAAFDTNGTLTDWDPSAFGSVRDILVHGDTVYVAGAFPRISGELRSRLAAVHVDGTLTDWDPSINGGSNIVNTLSLADGIIYAGGDFTTVGVETRNGLAAINATGTGSVTGWNPPTAVGSIFNDIEMLNGILYTGGDFSVIGGTSVTNLAAIDAITGNATSWIPETDGTINALTIGSGNIYIGGNFTTVEKEARKGVAAIDDTGAVLSWDAQLTGTSSVFVNSISTNQESLFFGGFFANVNYDPENNLAAVYLFDETDPVFTSATNINVAENTTGTIYKASTDENVTFSLGSSKDEALFSLSVGEISFLAAPDFENPGDDNTDNQYLIDITATDIAGNATTQQIIITVIDTDEVAPVITLIGVNPQIIELGTAYTELGATAVDNVDGDITGSIVIDVSSLDVTTLGTYSVTYNVQDVSGNSALELTRTVNVVDTTDPNFTSAANLSIDENISTSEIIYTATATDAGTITYSLGGSDAGSFNLGASTGEMTFITSPDFETQSSYSVIITATDNSNNAADLMLTITVNDLDEGAPVFTSATDVSVDENISTSEIFYTATATDGGTITYSLGGSDAGGFNLGSSSGELTFIASPDFETQSNYSVTITATDDSNNTADLMLTITINDLDEEAPVFTSAIDVSVDENISTSEIFYTATATDGGTITYSLGGSDANSFNLGASSGEMTFTTSPDFETQSSYSVTITAMDDSNNAADLMLTITVNDLDEGAPVFTSATGVSVDENISTSEIFYIATATDGGTITYSLGGNDASSFNLGASSGELTFITSPDFETQSSYSVTITAMDESNNAADLMLTISVNDLDEEAPAFTSSTDVSVDENISTSEIFYTATATDGGT